MKTEQLTMSADQRQQLTTMLQSQGISQAEIDQIINGDYESYDTGTDLENSYGALKNMEMFLRNYLMVIQWKNYKNKEYLQIKYSNLKKC